jgi:methionine aminotransferase
MPEFPAILNPKLPQVGTTIFTVMSKLAQEQNAINLSQGFPNFDVDPKLVELAHQYMQEGYNQYTHMFGLPKLRERLSDKMKAAYGVKFDPESEINITAGATQAIFTAITALVHEDDEVVIFTPAYDCYAPAVELQRGKPIYIQMRSPEYRIDWDEVKKRVNRKTRMIVINTPHNPTGMVLTREDLDELAVITSGSDIIVLSDEVYEHIIFDGRQHQSAASHEELVGRSLIIGSFGKTFHVTGWKMGYVAGPAALMAEFRKVHQYVVFTCNTPMQYALADYIADEKHFSKLPMLYQRKRDLFIDSLEGSSFDIAPSQGTYFQLLGYSSITKKVDTQVAQDWTKKFKIASIPVSVFYHNPVDDHVLRFCFAKDDETIVNAAKILREI